MRIVPNLDDISSALAVTDIFVHPATFREGFGLSIAEAMIAKIPVIVTDIPAVNSMFQNGVNGLVVPPKDPEAIAKAIVDHMFKEMRMRPGPSFTWERFPEWMREWVPIHLFLYYARRPATKIKEQAGEYAFRYATDLVSGAENATEGAA